MQCASADASAASNGTQQVPISGATRLYAITGDPIVQVRSPKVINPRVAIPGHDMLINATAIGMATGDGLPVALDGLGPEILVIDVIHKPGATPFVDRARALGCQAFDGHFMLNGQAEELAAFFIDGAR